MVTVDRRVTCFRVTLSSPVAEYPAYCDSMYRDYTWRHWVVKPIFLKVTQLLNLLAYCGILLLISREFALPMVYCEFLNLSSLYALPPPCKLCLGLICVRTTVSRTSSITKVLPGLVSRLICA